MYSLKGCRWMEWMEQEMPFHPTCGVFHAKDRNSRSIPLYSMDFLESMGQRAKTLVLSD